MAAYSFFEASLVVNYVYSPVNCFVSEKTFPSWDSFGNVADI